MGQQIDAMNRFDGVDLRTGGVGSGVGSSIGIGGISSSGSLNVMADPAAPDPVGVAGAAAAAAAYAAINNAMSTGTSVPLASMGESSVSVDFQNLFNSRLASRNDAYRAVRWNSYLQGRECKQVRNLGGGQMTIVCATALVKGKRISSHDIPNAYCDMKICMRKDKETNMWKITKGQVRHESAVHATFVLASYSFLSR